MSVVLLVVTDGRDYCLGETVVHLEDKVHGPITEWVMMDDTGSSGHAEKLRGFFPHFTVLCAGRRQGFGGAIRYAWDYLARHSDAEWVLHWEDDMIPTRPVPLEDMVALSVDQPHLAQVALRRQAWNAEERAAGGYVEAAPGWYVEREQGGRRWLESVRNWTTNPSVFRLELCAQGWPEGPQSEGRYGFLLRERGLPWGIPGGQVRFGLFGGLVDGREWVRHIGEHRVGTGY